MSRTGFRHPQVDAAGVAVALAIAGAAAWMGIVPAIRAEKSLADVFGDMTRSQRQLEQLRTEYSSVSDRLDRAEHELDQTAIELSTFESLPARQRELHELLRESSVRVDQIISGTPVAGEQLDTTRLRVSGGGPFPAVVHVMRALREEFPDMAVTSFQLIGASPLTGPEGEAGDMISFALDLEWYTARAGRAGE